MSTVDSAIPVLTPTQAMELSAALQADLKQMAQESKKFPDIYQATEQAILSLKTVARSESPTEISELFDSDVIVRPLLLASGSRSPDLALTALATLHHLLFSFPSQRLISTTVTLASILRDVPEERVHVRLIQVLLQAFPAHAFVHAPSPPSSATLSIMTASLPSAISVCAALVSTGAPSIAGAAHAAMQRLLSLLLDFAQAHAPSVSSSAALISTQASINAAPAASPSTLTPPPLEAPSSPLLALPYHLLLALVTAARPHSPLPQPKRTPFPSLSSLPAPVAMEAILSALAHTALFSTPELAPLLSSHVLALVCELAADADSFTLQSLALRTAALLIASYGHLPALAVAVELLVSLICRAAAPNNAPRTSWAALVAARTVLRAPHVVFRLFSAYEYVPPAAASPTNGLPHASSPSSAATLSLLLSSTSALLSLAETPLAALAPLRAQAVRWERVAALGAGAEALPPVTSDHVVACAVDALVVLAEAVVAIAKAPQQYARGIPLTATASASAAADADAAVTADTAVDADTKAATEGAVETAPSAWAGVEIVAEEEEGKTHDMALPVRAPDAALVCEAMLAALSLPLSHALATAFALVPAHDGAEAVLGPLVSLTALLHRQEGADALDDPAGPVPVGERWVEAATAKSVDTRHTYPHVSALSAQAEAALRTLLSLCLPEAPHAATPLLTPALLHALSTAAAGGAAPGSGPAPAEAVDAASAPPLTPSTPVSALLPQLRAVSALPTIGDVAALTALTPHHVLALRSLFSLCAQHHHTLTYAWPHILPLLTLAYSVLTHLADANPPALASQPPAPPTPTHAAPPRPSMLPPPSQSLIVAATELSAELRITLTSLLRGPALLPLLSQAVALTLAHLPASLSHPLAAAHAHAHAHNLAITPLLAPLPAWSVLSSAPLASLVALTHALPLLLLTDATDALAAHPSFLARPALALLLRAAHAMLPVPHIAARALGAVVLHRALVHALHCDILTPPIASLPAPQPPHALLPTFADLLAPLLPLAQASAGPDRDCVLAPLSSFAHSHALTLQHHWSPLLDALAVLAPSPLCEAAARLVAMALEHSHTHLPLTALPALARCAVALSRQRTHANVAFAAVGLLSRAADMVLAHTHAARDVVEDEAGEAPEEGAETDTLAAAVGGSPVLLRAAEDIYLAARAAALRAESESAQNPGHTPNPEAHSALTSWSGPILAGTPLVQCALSFLTHPATPAPVPYPIGDVHDSSTEDSFPCEHSGAALPHAQRMLRAVAATAVQLAEDETVLATAEADVGPSASSLALRTALASGVAAAMARAGNAAWPTDPAPAAPDSDLNEHFPTLPTLAPPPTTTPLLAHVPAMIAQEQRVLVAGVNALLAGAHAAADAADAGNDAGKSWPLAPPTWLAALLRQPAVLAAVQLHAAHLQAAADRGVLLCAAELCALAAPPAKPSPSQLPPTGEVRNTAARLLFRLLDSHAHTLTPTAVGAAMAAVAHLLRAAVDSERASTPAMSPAEVDVRPDSRAGFGAGGTREREDKLWRETRVLCAAAVPHMVSKAVLVITSDATKGAAPVPPAWPAAFAELLAALSAAVFASHQPLSSASLASLRALLLTPALAQTPLWSQLLRVLTHTARGLMHRLDILTAAGASASALASFARAAPEVRASLSLTDYSPCLALLGLPADADTDALLAAADWTPFPACPGPLMRPHARLAASLAAAAAPSLPDLGALFPTPTNALSRSAPAPAWPLAPVLLPFLATEWLRAAVSFVETLSARLAQSTSAEDALLFLTLVHALHSRHLALPLSLPRASTALLGVVSLRPIVKESLLTTAAYTAITAAARTHPALALDYAVAATGALPDHLTAALPSLPLGVIDAHAPLLALAQELHHEPHTLPMHTVISALTAACALPPMPLWAVLAIDPHCIALLETFLRDALANLFTDSRSSVAAPLLQSTVDFDPTVPLDAPKLARALAPLNAEEAKALFLSIAPRVAELSTLLHAFFLAPALPSHLLLCGSWLAIAPTHLPANTTLAQVRVSADFATEARPRPALVAALTKAENAPATLGAPVLNTDVFVPAPAPPHLLTLQLFTSLEEITSLTATHIIPFFLTHAPSDPAFPALLRTYTYVTGFALAHMPLTFSLAPISFDSAAAPSEHEPLLPVAMPAGALPQALAHTLDTISGLANSYRLRALTTFPDIALALARQPQLLSHAMDLLKLTAGTHTHHAFAAITPALLPASPTVSPLALTDDHLAMLWQARIATLATLACPAGPLAIPAAKAVSDCAALLLEAFVAGSTTPLVQLPFQSLPTPPYLPVLTAAELAATLQSLAFYTIAPEASAALSSVPHPQAHLLSLHALLCECISSDDEELRRAVATAIMRATQPLVARAATLGTPQ